MPFEAILSCIRPISFCKGPVRSVYFPRYRLFLYIFHVRFTLFFSWLGKNSKHGKIKRQIGEIQSHSISRTILTISALRLDYIPIFARSLTEPLVVKGKVVIC